MRRILSVAAAAAILGGGLALVLLELREERRRERPAFALAGFSAPRVVSDGRPQLRGRGLPGASVTLSVHAAGRPGGRPVRRVTTRVADDGTFERRLDRPLVVGTYVIEALERDGSGASRRAVSSPFVVWRHTAAAPGVSLRGTFEGGPTIGVNGPSDAERSAVSFDGIDDYLGVPHSARLDLERGVTMLLWMKRSRLGAWQVLVGKPGDGRSKLENYSLWLNESDRAVAFFGDGREYARVETPAPLDTAWHHVAATYDNATARIYVDGALKASAPSSVRMTTNALPLNIGRANGGTNFYAGLLDRVELYRTSLGGRQIRALYGAMARARRATPLLTLTTPEPGSSTRDRTPAFAGRAGTTSLDSPRVNLKLYRGKRVTGTPLQSLGTSAAPSGAWAVSASESLPPGTYTAQAEQRNATGNLGVSEASTFTIAARSRAGRDPVIVGAGDIADCSGSGDEATADLLERFPGATVLTLGDNAYDDGTPQQFRTCYDVSWGRARMRTRPTLGGHDYATPRAAGYFSYFRRQLAPFGAAASDPRRGYYSYDLGTWHIVHTNTECSGVAGCDVKAQLAWLRNDLRASRSRCTLAITHNPRWSSGSVHGDQLSVRPYWEAFSDFGVDLVLSGDDHDYERFAPQDAHGLWDPRRGIRQLVVGTGGYSHYRFARRRARPNSEVRNDDTFGVIKLILRGDGYDWEFVPEAGRTFTDSGTDMCH